MLRKTLLSAAIIAASGLAVGKAAVAAPTITAPTPYVQSAESKTDKLNINTATADQIANAMVGVGQSKAENIVKFREQLGGFKSLEQLLEVKGIGQRTLDKNRAKLTLE
ncbi:competence protein ComEA [Idiomarina fontislapidosi]|uniref:DNA uptake protein n=1 Tax=Idiomarina fontislapidosi TaxID=263723 RepID=A0A432Y9G7_9GAMM|nr:ComEA family DNA-binding protein [Idiomarina fontislapidosi]PYE34406.1 competence protein ComEA [Idiomarina fontislapidosi]RUO57635.1 DNA uptake protein [Idiomarina fontislapidosi]